VSAAGNSTPTPRSATDGLEDHVQDHRVEQPLDLLTDGGRAKAIAIEQTGEGNNWQQGTRRVKKSSQWQGDGAGPKRPGQPSRRRRPVLLRQKPWRRNQELHGGGGDRDRSGPDREASPEASMEAAVRKQQYQEHPDRRQRTAHQR